MVRMASDVAVKTAAVRVLCANTVAVAGNAVAATDVWNAMVRVRRAKDVRVRKSGVRVNVLVGDEVIVGVDVTTVLVGVNVTVFVRLGVEEIMGVLVRV